MLHKKSIGDKVFDTFNYIFMTLLVVITVYPLLYVLFASISNPTKFLAHSGLLLYPLGPITLKGYAITFNNPNIVSGFQNTLIYVFVGVGLSLVLTSFGAYVLSRQHFYMKKFMMIMIVITMFFNGGMIPMFFLIKKLGIYDTRWSIILPVAIEAFNLIIMRTFFSAIPASLEESAILDGASDFKVFTNIIIPLSKPVIAVMVLYYGVANWNSYFNAMIYLKSRDLYPLQLILREILILNQNTTSAAAATEQMMEESLFRELVQYCAIVVSTFPILCIYPFLQKYFVKGVMIGAIKG